MSAHDVLRKKIKKETGKVCCTNSFTVLYSKNNDFATGSQSDPTLYLPRSKVYVKGPGTLNNIGFTFSGWNSKPYGTGVSYIEGDSFSITDNITLYARWTPSA
jgi:uncharacterized repeat protein (TIGR02543 family)